MGEKIRATIEDTLTQIGRDVVNQRLKSGVSTLKIEDIISDIIATSDADGLPSSSYFEAIRPKLAAYAQENGIEVIDTDTEEA